MHDWGLGVAENPALCWAWVEWARNHCGPMPEGAARIEDLDAEVEEAYDFFRAVRSASDRKKGTAMLRALRAEREPSGA